MQRIKGSFFSQFITFFVLITMMIFVFPVNVFAAGEVTLRSGTLVPVRVPTELSSKDLRTGDSVDLRVANDVVVDRNVVIESGSIVKATVTKGSSRGVFGAAGELEIQINRTTAVDGTNISLTGVRTVKGDDSQFLALALGLFLCLPALLIRGDHAVIAAGSIIETTVTSNYEISIE